MQNPFELVVRIMWSAFKQTTSDWADIRNNTKVHTFYWIHEGKGIFYTNRRHDVYQGMLFYMKPGTPMKMESAEGAPLAISMILFECCELTYTESRWHMPELVHQLPIPFASRCKGSSGMELDHAFNQITTAWSMGNPYKELESNADLLKLIAYLNQPALFPEQQDVYSVYLKIKEILEIRYADMQRGCR
ncbi:AraC family ligand binding domain-containing protein [Paenibacillus amylolyticus]|nr:AraC family ligand binding domain-containing protein [Paenibacillus amylolyticus]WFR60908.1 AraC family ligand binding domain-containing protein [Paenibacillus amylolyticus]